MKVNEIIEQEGLVEESKYPIYKYDYNMNRIYEEHEGGYRMRWEFNKNNQLTRYEDSDELRETIEYNEFGEKTFYTNDRDGRLKWEYNEFGDVTRFESYKNEWFNVKYDNNRNVVFYEDHKGTKKINIYNRKGQVTEQVITEDGKTTSTELKYKGDRVVYKYCSNGDFKIINRNKCLEKEGDTYYLNGKKMIKKTTKKEK